MSTLGHQFAEALAAKDYRRVEELLDPQVSFRGLTPSRPWEASDAAAVVSDVLRHWFEDSDHIDELVSVETARMADRDRVSYLIGGHNDDGPFLVEQQAYFEEENGRIVWIRVLCSGFRPAAQ